MKEGALLLAFLKQSRTVTKDYRFKAIEGIPGAEHVFLKTKEGPRKTSHSLSNKEMLTSSTFTEQRNVYIEKYKMV